MFLWWFAYFIQTKRDNQLKKCVLLLLAVIFWVHFKFKKHLVSGAERSRAAGVCFFHWCVYATFMQVSYSVFTCASFLFFVCWMCVYICINMQMHLVSHCKHCAVCVLCLSGGRKISLEISVFNPEEENCSLCEEKASNILALTFCLG